MNWYKTANNSIASRPATPQELRTVWHRIALAQRGLPEEAMLDVQKALDSPGLRTVVEHGGDIIHRMTDKYQFEITSPDPFGDVSSKLKRILKWLNDPYGFEKEVGEDIDAEAKRTGKTASEIEKNVKEKLSAFGKAHAELPQFNRMHALANEANALVGDFKFAQAAIRFRELLELVEDEDKSRRIAASIDPAYVNAAATNLLVS